MVGCLVLAIVIPNTHISTSGMAPFINPNDRPEQALVFRQRGRERRMALHVLLCTNSTRLFTMLSTCVYMKQSRSTRPHESISQFMKWVVILLTTQIGHLIKHKTKVSHVVTRIFRSSAMQNAIKAVHTQTQKPRFCLMLICIYIENNY